MPIIDTPSPIAKFSVTERSFPMSPISLIEVTLPRNDFDLTDKVPPIYPVLITLQAAPTVESPDADICPSPRISKDVEMVFPTFKLPPQERFSWTVACSDALRDPPNRADDRRLSEFPISKLPVIDIDEPVLNESAPLRRPLSRVHE